LGDESPLCTSHNSSFSALFRFSGSEHDAL
jgi:hypothetical protein